jgi:hypothetical protein
MDTRANVAAARKLSFDLRLALRSSTCFVNPLLSFGGRDA